MMRESFTKSVSLFYPLPNVTQFQLEGMSAGMTEKRGGGMEGVWKHFSVLIFLVLFVSRQKRTRRKKRQFQFRPGEND